MQSLLVMFVCDPPPPTVPAPLRTERTPCRRSSLAAPIGEEALLLALHMAKKSNAKDQFKATANMLSMRSRYGLRSVYTWQKK